MKFFRALFFLLSSALAARAAADADGAQFFTAKIEPILRENCFKCHSHGDKIKGGLVLDSPGGILSGGETGPAVVPNDVAKSLLLTAISYQDADLKMPPKDKKLSDEQIALLNDWVKMGAPMPEEKGQKMAKRAKGQITDEERKWWAFQPVKKIAGARGGRGLGAKRDRPFHPRSPQPRKPPARAADAARAISRGGFISISSACRRRRMKCATSPKPRASIGKRRSPS